MRALALAALGAAACTGGTETGNPVTAELRMRKLIEETRRCAEESSYYETPFDMNVGRA